ncbi:putative ras-like small GTPases [Leishmania major strain Friedlin]|uniref:Putative ras-like small GTPases n=1 Tax=Leishmania major TaxID=5664 RepID=Q4QFL7_LEIMA|nr:putative ras-like small GTPases [Leishmania major strain Friedlin]CAG9571311.1 ras-like_small_GTPases_-_putative [Leishmania major strain Friedlin]CAJ03184.1 putative ras-like small GTPases [Leishmania major strain Friedlin]|eukprot:XP_001687717.1 putative ras-like small GTPases [Leishmania major strain Friedlin]
MSGNGAVQSPALAKPVLDLSQVRCIPFDQWVPDAQVVNCMAPDCSNSFSLFNRKHHCRMCGHVFCSSCCNNLVYIPAAVVNKANSSTEGAAAAGSYSAMTNTSLSSVVTPEPQQFNRACASDGSALPNGMRRGPQAPAAQGLDVSSASSSALLPGPLPVCSDGNGHPPSNALTAPSAVTALPSSMSPSTQAAVPCRVCASCSYEVQLVVSTRQENGEPRRRSRGELKMIQRVLLVNVMSFLTLRDLANVSLVSADFYFMSRDNIIWYQYNMTRWVQEAKLPRLSSHNSRAAASRMQQQRGPSWCTYSSGSGPRSSLVDDMFSSAPVIQDATALSESEAAKRVISLHARYNYTQFLDFARRQEMAWCEGLSSFSLGARLLLSSPIRVALVGPCGIGKTASAHAFLGEKPSQMVVRPTIGFERRAVRVRLARGLSAEAVLHIYDLSGADRYGELRRFVCRHCHAIGLCYDPSRKVTLVQAADIMMGLESALGPQPVVVCGLMRQPHHTSSSGSVPLNYHRAGPARLPAVVSAVTAVGLSAPLVRRDQSSHAVPVGSAESAAEAAGGVAGESMLAAPICGVANGCNTSPRASSSPAGTAVTLPGGMAENGAHESCDRLQADAAVSPMPSPPQPPFAVASPQSRALEVSVEDAVGITVRGHSSIHCPLLHPTPLFEALVQSVLDLLVEATVASTSTISEISAELTTHGSGSGPQSFPTCCPSSLSAGSAPANATRVASTRRRPHASRAIMEDLRNLTMQPCALDILLDRK